MLQIIRSGKEAAVLKKKFEEKYLEYKSKTWF